LFFELALLEPTPSVPAMSSLARQARELREPKAFADLARKPSLHSNLSPVAASPALTAP
jgi:hypothetical protein